jgi:Integrase core domain
MPLNKGAHGILRNLCIVRRVPSENSIRPGLASRGRIIASLKAMFAILHALGIFVVDLFKSRSRLEAENLFLRHQLAIALRRAPPRFRLHGSDRALIVWMTKLWPSLLGAAQVAQPETILRWHRAGFQVFWRWKSRNRAGRPKIDRGLRDLIPRMSRENALWGASRIHGELLMLGFQVAQSTVSKYMVRGQNPPRHPTAEWLARQITEAFPWISAPTYLVRDNDRAYGHIFTSRVRAMGMRDRPISPGSPWQNGIAERLIGTVRRECLDRILIFGESHLRRVLASYAAYYNQTRTHLALQKDAPLRRAVQRSGAIVAIPILAGLHHQYVRI